MNATCMYVTFFSASIVLDLLLNYFDGVSHSKNKIGGIYLQVRNLQIYAIKHMDIPDY